MTTETENETISNEKNDDEKPLIIAESTESNEIPTNSPEKVKRVGRKKRDESISMKNEAPPLFEQPVIVEGKRSRKPTSRLELTDVSPPRKEFSVPQGNGKALGEIPFINHQLTHMSIDDLTQLRMICLGRRASKANLRKNLQDFKGFTFDRESEEFQRHLTNLTKLKKDQIDQLNEILGLETSNDPKNILEFLLEPKDLGKTIVERPVREKTTKIIENEVDEFDETDEIVESDDDYIESDDDDDDDDEDFRREKNHDDPDDFAYQPGKKAPKKKKRQRTPSKRPKRNSKKTKKDEPTATADIKTDEI